MNEFKDYTVKVSNLANFQETGRIITELFNETGSSVQKSFEVIRAIYVNSTQEQADHIANIKGVESVRASGSFQLPPMHTKIPQ